MKNAKKSLFLKSELLVINKEIKAKIKNQNYYEHIFINHENLKI